MFDQIKELMARWHAMREVDSMTDRDLDDLGMTRGQVNRFVRMPRDVPDRVAAMAGIFGLSADQIKADHGRYLDLLDTCGTCGHRGACIRRLDGDPAQAQDRFCPNAAEFRNMAAV